LLDMLKAWFRWEDGCVSQRNVKEDGRLLKSFDG